jgi:shikimate kinase
MRLSKHRVLVKTSLALIGFMGVGKTSVGKFLAELTGKQLVEVDSVIVMEAGKSIPQIFQEDGEIVFREKEMEAIKKIASGRNQIIDCGGGVVLNKINIDRLKKNAVVVWLKASSDVIAKRTALDDGGRPLLEGKKAESEIQELLSLREPLYEMASDIQVDSSSSEAGTVARNIIEKLRQNADFDL